MKAALLVVDLQNEFFADGSPAPASLRDATEYVNAAIAAFRTAKLPVVVVEDVEGDRKPGAPGFATHASVAVLPSDPHIAKHSGNSFWKTGLEEELRAAGVDTVVVSGFCAEYCVLDTYRGARERGFRAALLQHGIASPSAENLRAVASFCEGISIGMIEGMTENAARS